MKEPSIYDIYAFQLLHYLVVQHGYQIVTIRQQREDIWLMNGNTQQYPIIRISTSNNQQTLNNIDYLRSVHRAIADMVKKEDKLLILNTNPESTPIDNEFLTQIPIQPKQCLDTFLLQAFPDIQEIPHEVKDRQKEYVRISKSLEQMQMNLMRKQRKEMGFFKRIPKLTGIICLICIAMWLIASMVAMYLESNVQAAILTGAYYKMNVVSMQEYWRFLTAGFLHMDIFHLMMNLMVLINVGIACEKSFSKVQYVTILCVAIFTGNLFVYLTEGNVIGLGISGGIFGLLGAFIATLFENGSIKHPMVKATILRLVLLNILISIMPGVSLLAHLGGCISGVFLGIIFVKSTRWVSLKKHVTIAFAILMGMTCGMATNINAVDPLDASVDRSLLATVRALGWDDYADYMQSRYLKYYSEEELGL